MNRIAERMLGLQESAIRSMTARCRAVGAVNLGQGLCQVDPPESLLNHGAKVFAAVSHSYSAAEGNEIFLQAVAEKIARYTGTILDPTTQIVTAIGATGAFTATLAAHLNPGDGVLLLEPFYGYHLSAIKLFQLQAQPVRLTAPHFELTNQALRAAVSNHTRAIVVCTPANPSGRRFTSHELERVAKIATELDLLVITDEIYEHIYFGNGPHVAPATVADLGERTVTISGLSKTYSVPGWRLGYASGPRDLVRPIRVAADSLAVCAPTPLQQIAVHALTLPESYYESLRAMYYRKRQHLASAFLDAGMQVNEPEGAYYLLVDCSPLGVTTGSQAAEILLENALVGTVPGEAFYLTHPELPVVRACFSLPDDVIAEAADRLARARLC